MLGPSLFLKAWDAKIHQPLKSAKLYSFRGRDGSEKKHSSTKGLIIREYRRRRLKLLICRPWHDWCVLLTFSLSASGYTYALLITKVGD